MKRVSAHCLFSYAVFCLCLLVALFVRAGWEGAPDWDGYPPFKQTYPNEHQLLAACRQGRVDIVKYWLNQKGFRPNDEFISGLTGNKISGLRVASHNGHNDGVTLLIEAGADLNQGCFDGATPLFLASQDGHAKVVEILVKAGADLNQGPDDGATPLFMASQNGHVEVVAILVKAGADPLQTWHHHVLFDWSPQGAARLNKLIWLTNPKEYERHASIIQTLKPAIKVWKEQKKIQAKIDGNTGCFDGFVDVMKHDIKHTLAPLMRRISLKSTGH